MHVPRSFDKPHIISGDGRFFIRYGSSSIPATRMQVEQMFNSSAQDKQNFDNLLNDRNLNEKNPDFLDNYYSQRIRNFYRLCDPGLKENPHLNTPLLNLSILPAFDFEKNRLDTSETEIFKNLIGKMNDPNLPYDEIYFFDGYTGESEYDIDGCCFFHHINVASTNEQFLRDYLKIFNNGHIENCLSTDFFIHYPGKPFSMVLTPLLAYIDKFLEFSIQLLKDLDYNDKTYFQCSFKNIQNYIIRSFFNDGHEPDEYSNISRAGPQAVLKNYKYNNYVFKKFFNILEMNDEKKFLFLKEIEKEILLLFGQNTSLAFQNQKINTQKISSNSASWIRTDWGPKGHLTIRAQSDSN